MSDVAQRENEVKEAREQFGLAQEAYRKADIELRKIEEEEHLTRWREEYIPLTAWPKSAADYAKCSTNKGLMKLYVDACGELAKLRKGYDEAHAAGVREGVEQGEKLAREWKEKLDRLATLAAEAQRELAKLRSEIAEKNRVIHSMPEAAAMANGIVVFMRMLRRASEERDARG